MVPKLITRETSTLESTENVLVKKSGMMSTESLRKKRAQICWIKINHKDAG